MIKDCKETVAKVREVEVREQETVPDVSGIVEQDFVLPQ
jgi:hypothetical protein